GVPSRRGLRCVCHLAYAIRQLLRGRLPAGFCPRRDLRYRPHPVVRPVTLVEIDVLHILAGRPRLRSTTFRKDLRIDARAGVDAADWKILAQRMAVEAVPHQNALEIRMAIEADAHHVERLAFVPVRRLPDG